MMRCPRCGGWREENPTYHAIGEGTPPRPGTRVQVYRNLNIREGVPAWSVKEKASGLVVAIAPHALLSNVKLHVGEGGRQRVIREKRKYVHAWFEGDWEEMPPEDVVWQQVRYNPYLLDSFVVASSGRPVRHAAWARLGAGGAFAVLDRLDNPVGRSGRSGRSDVEVWNG